MLKKLYTASLDNIEYIEVNGVKLEPGVTTYETPDEQQNEASYKFTLVRPNEISFTGTDIKEIDLTELDLSKTVSLHGIFKDCKLLTTVTPFELPQELTDLSEMFSGCSILPAALALDYSSVVNMSGMYMNCTSLTDYPQFLTYAVQDMSNMFAGCTGLKTIQSFYSPVLKNVSGMFKDCTGLTDLKLAFDTELNITSIEKCNSMFSGCSNLADLDISGIETENVTDMTDMFAGCTALKTLKLSNKFYTHNTLDLFKDMPADCKVMVPDATGSYDEVIAALPTTVTVTNYTGEVLREGQPDVPVKSNIVTAIF